MFCVSFHIPQKYRIYTIGLLFCKVSGHILKSILYFFLVDPLFKLTSDAPKRQKFNIEFNMLGQICKNVERHTLQKASIIKTLL